MISIDINEPDEINISWVDGHHEHQFLHRYASIEEATDVAVDHAERWMSPDIIWCTRLSDGRFLSQWREDAKSPGAPSWLGELGSPQPGPGETIRKYSWTGEHDEVLTGPDGLASG